MKAEEWVERYRKALEEHSLESLWKFLRELPREAEHQFHLVHHSALDDVNGVWRFPDGSGIFLDIEADGKFPINPPLLRGKEEEDGNGQAIVAQKA